ncbi:MAG TPA: hypothetical protein VE777_10730 [Gaiellales bacterium]|nr:hypothetical protein [Gaiellales bacterium]
MAVPPFGPTATAIDCPSGENEGGGFAYTPLLTVLRPLPSGRIIIRSPTPPLPFDRVNAIQRPSGDHTGHASDSSLAVTLVWPRPSGCMT